MGRGGGGGVTSQKTVLLLNCFNKPLRQQSTRGNIESEEHTSHIYIFFKVRQEKISRISRML